MAHLRECALLFAASLLWPSAGCLDAGARPTSATPDGAEARAGDLATGGGAADLGGGAADLGGSVDLAPPSSIADAATAPADLAGVPGNPPSASGSRTGTGPVASWTACWVYDDVGATADHLYHQGISYTGTKDYVVLGRSWIDPGCNGAPQDTFNDFAQVLQRNYQWWFTHFPNYKYVRFLWVDGNGTTLQDSGCLDYNAIGACN